MRIAVTGANSSVGQNLLARAIENGDVTVVAGVRSERAAASLPRSPQIAPRIVSYNEVDELAEIMEGAACIVHLAGILIQSRTSTYESANVAATASVVEASRKADMGHIVLISVLGANTDSPNGFLKSKGEAERVVAESGMPSTIIRTPILLGPGTAGAASLVGTAARVKAKLLGGGHQVLRPLDIDDLSLAILQVCQTQPVGTSVHELVGPESITYRALVVRVAEMMKNPLTIGTIPLWIAKLGAAVTSRLKGGGISPDVIDVITSSEVVQKNADAEMGISLTPLSRTLETILTEKKQET